MSSFSAKRQGRSRPSDMILGRRRSKDKSMPSPSFNSSMSLGNIDDVFCDSSRSTDRLRHHYLAIPTTPSTLYAGSSPGTKMERLPSLTDIFHRDILSPPSSNIVSLSSVRSNYCGTGMHRTGSMSSDSSGRSRAWLPTFNQEARAGSIGPPATPLSPFFSTGQTVVSPTTVSPDRRSDTIYGLSDGERTPRAFQRPSFDYNRRSDLNGSSPPCPGAPLIGIQSRGHFESQTWQTQACAGSLGLFEGIQRRSSYGRNPTVFLERDELVKERAAMSALEARMPKAAGLCGLGIYMDEDNIQSPFRKAESKDSQHAESERASPFERQIAFNEHTGLTPMVKASKVSDSSSTPTRSKAKRSSSSALQTSFSSKIPASQVQASQSATATRKKVEMSRTPLNKSRPMFRLENGSCKPKGHKMSPDSSPWGVFGAKDGWKPLAPPNVSRAIAEANKLVLDTGPTIKLTSTSSKTSPTGKREALDSKSSSPLKRSRTGVLQTTSSPFKENVAPSLRKMSPSKRAPMLSKTHRDSPTALPLTGIR